MFNLNLYETNVFNNIIILETWEMVTKMYKRTCNM